MDRVPVSATSVLLHVFLPDASNTSGAGKAGLDASTVSVFYHRDKSATTSAMSLTNMSIGTWASSGITGLGQGAYLFGAPDAAFASGASKVLFMFTGASIPPTPLAVVIESLSTFNPSTDSVGLKAQTHSAATVGVGDYAAKDMSSALTVGVGIAKPSAVSVRLEAMDYSSVVTTGVGIAKPSAVSVRLEAQDYSSAVTVGAGIAKPSAFSVRLESLDYSSAVTVGAGIAKPSAFSVRLESLDYSSKVTVGVGVSASDYSVAIAPGTYSGVTVGASMSSAEVADAVLLRAQYGGAWGSAGSRVRDAIASGLLFISTGESVTTVLNADGTSAFTRATVRAELNAIQRTT